MVPFAATVRGGSQGLWLLLFRQRNQTGFAPFFEPVTLTANVHRGRVMQQTVEDGCCDDRVAEDRTPFAVAFVRSENDAASFVAGADELEENRRAQIVQRQISHLVDDEDLRRKIDAQAPIKPAFPVSAPEIGDQIVRGHEVGGLSGLNRRFRQSHRQMSFPHAGRSQQDHVGSFMHEPQRPQFADLPLINRWLKAEIELIECFQVRQVGQLQPRLQVTLLSRIGFRAHHFEQEIAI